MGPRGDPIRGAKDLLRLTPSEFEAIIGNDPLDAPDRRLDLIRVARALAILLPRADGPAAWIRSANSSPLFGGRSAIDLLADGGEGLQRVRQYLEAQTS